MNDIITQFIQANGGSINSSHVPSLVALLTPEPPTAPPTDRPALSDQIETKSKKKKG